MPCRHSGPAARARPCAHAAASSAAAATAATAGAAARAHSARHADAAAAAPAANPAPGAAATYSRAAWPCSLCAACSSAACCGRSCRRPAATSWHQRCRPGCRGAGSPADQQCPVSAGTVGGAAGATKGDVKSVLWEQWLMASWLLYPLLVSCCLALGHLFLLPCCLLLSCRLLRWRLRFPLVTPNTPFCCACRLGMGPSRARPTLRLSRRSSKARLGNCMILRILLRSDTFGMLGCEGQLESLGAVLRSAGWGPGPGREAAKLCWPG